MVQDHLGWFLPYDGRVLVVRVQSANSWTPPTKTWNTITDGSCEFIACVKTLSITRVLCCHRIRLPRYFYRASAAVAATESREYCRSATSAPRLKSLAGSRGLGRRPLNTQVSPDLQTQSVCRRRHCVSCTLLTPPLRASVLSSDCGERFVSFLRSCGSARFNGHNSKSIQWR